MGKRVPKRAKLEFADELKAWRARKRLTQVEAARVLEVPLKTLQNWEIARTMPTGLGLLTINRIISHR